MAPDVGRAAGITRRQTKTLFGCHFQGGFRTGRNPGLKPWAVLYNRFAAKDPTHPIETRSWSLHLYPIDLFQTQRIRPWSKAADDNCDDNHTEGDEAERTD